MTSKRDDSGRFAPKRTADEIEIDQTLRWFDRLVLGASTANPELVATFMLFGWKQEPVRKRFLALIEALATEDQQPCDESAEGAEPC